MSHLSAEISLKNSILIAVGGNSLIRAGQKGTVEEQITNARRTCEQIAEIAERGYRIVMTHGNGPQVGAQLLRSEAGSAQAYTLPLDVCGAMTQGEIGYLLQTTLQTVLRERRLEISVVALITQVLVNGSDPAFQNPTKPIGPFYSEEVAQRKSKELGWVVVDDATRGYRRVVPSPKPCGIVELDIIEDCLDRGNIVIAAGGGGIPVVYEDGVLRGVEAVIDKDRASALLARQLRLRKMIISTDVEYVYRNYKEPGQEAIRRMDIASGRAYLESNQFREGSMKPKIEAAIDFIEGGGEEVIITRPEKLVEALHGCTGTSITSGPAYHEALSRH